MNHPTNQQTGYVAIMTILILSAIGIFIATTLLGLSINNSQISIVIKDSNQAKALANACAEKALQQIRDNTTFVGNGNLSLSNGSCTYTITSLGGDTRQINSTGTVNNIIRKAKITIDQINPQIIISFWQEVGDF